MIKRTKILLCHVMVGMLMLLEFSANANTDTNTQVQTPTEQKFNTHNNGIIKAFASKDEITRIAFEAQVTEVHAISQELEYVVNGKDIYLKLQQVEKPINFFVKTEDEMTYKLILAANEMPATQIFIHNQKAKLTLSESISVSKTEYRIQPTSELKNRVAKIIQLTLELQRHLGFTIISKNLNLTSPNKALKMKLVGTVSGNMLLAEKIYIANKSDKLQKLNLKDFMSKDYLSVYLAKEELLPKEECVLIRIIDQTQSKN